MSTKKTKKPVVEEVEEAATIVEEEVTAVEIEVIAETEAEEAVVKPVIVKSEAEVEELPVVEPKLKDLVSIPRPTAKKVEPKKGEYVLLCNLKHNGMLYKAGTKFTEPKAKTKDYLANGTLAIKE